MFLFRNFQPFSRDFAEVHYKLCVIIEYGKWETIIVVDEVENKIAECKIFSNSDIVH